MSSVVFETFVFISSDAECNGFNYVTLLLREKTISQDGTVPDLTGKNFVINQSNPPQQAFRAQMVGLQKKMADKHSNKR